MNNLHHILIVEDDENDAYLLERCFRRIGCTAEFHRCQNAAEAISYLKEAVVHGRSPQLVLTDLKMPGGSGFDLLHWMKDNPRAMVVPTVVFSSSNDIRDVKAAYCLGANAYLRKPGGIDALQAQVAALVNFWSQCETLDPAIDGPCIAPHQKAA